MMISDSTQTQSACIHQRQRPSHQDVIEHFGGSLSTEDRETMLKEVEAMQSAGATHREIKTYVDQTLSDLGVELPHLTQKSARQSAGRSGEESSNQTQQAQGPRRDLIKDIGHRLDEDLRNELMELIKSLKEEGSDFEGVKEVVDAKLSEHGIEHPPPPGSLIRVTG